MADRKGFTLVELLIALVIFSLIASLVFVSFGQGLSLWERADRKFDHWDQVVLFQDWWRGLLHGAESFQVQRRNVFQPLFLGEPQRLLFLTSSPLLQGVPSLVEVAFQDGALTYAERSLFGLTPEELDERSFSFPSRHAMLQPVRDVEVEYLDQVEGKDVWAPRFDSAAGFRIPLAVRIRLVFKNEPLELLAGLPGSGSTAYRAVVPRII